MLKPIVLLALVSIFVPFSAQAVSLSSDPQPAPQQAQRPASFDGRWEGTIAFDKDSFINELTTPKEGLLVRIEIHDAVVRVFTKPENSDFEEFMPGYFHIAPVMANAVIFGSHYSEVWTETWAFVITKKDDDTLLVNYSRMVNNNVPPSEPQSKFSSRGFGEFKRTGP